MPVKGARLEKTIEIGVAVHDVELPKDIVVTTPEDFEWRKDVVGTIERPAVQEATVLYDRESLDIDQGLVFRILRMKMRRVVVF